jgi:hypothetical protein
MRNTILSIVLTFAAFLCGSAALQAQSAPQEKPDMPSPQQSSLAPSAQEPYVPIFGKERAKWFVKASIGPQSLAAGLFTSSINTARDKPVEYGTAWEGFGKRYAMRLTGVATSSAIEASLGSIWGEDPRYFRTSGQPFGKRIRNVVVMTSWPNAPIATWRRPTPVTPQLLEVIFSPILGARTVKLPILPQSAVPHWVLWDAWRLMPSRNSRPI